MTRKLALLFEDDPDAEVWHKVECRALEVDHNGTKKQVLYPYRGDRGWTGSMWSYERNAARTVATIIIVATWT